MIQRKMINKFLLILILILPIYYTQASAIELTIYSSASPGSVLPNSFNGNDALSGYAYVLDQRNLELKSGQNEIRYTNIPTYLDPTTVQFRSLTDEAGTEIVKQEYRFDLLNNQTFLSSNMGKEITVEQGHGSDLGSFTGTLLSIQDGLTLQDKNQQIITVSNYSAIRFPMPENELFKQPTLIWKIAAKKQGPHKTETRYQTRGIAWSADYTAVFEEKSDPNQGTLALSSWVSVANRSGTNFDNADLKLVAGNVNVAQAFRRMPRPNMMMAAKMADSGGAEGFTEKPFFEYHVYTLNSKISLANNTTQQIKFLPKISKIAVEKLYIYDNSSGIFYSGYPNTEKFFNLNPNAKIDVYLKWKNSEKEGLGIPLPAGRVRISAITKSNQTPEFVGEDIINHTAKDEDIQVKMGSAFDLSAEKKQTDFSLDTNRHVIEESFEITLKNHKDQDVKVLVKENLYRTANWEVLKNSNPFEKINSGTVDFPMIVKAGEESKLQYTVRYTW